MRLHELYREFISISEEIMKNPYSEETKGKIENFKSKVEESEEIENLVMENLNNLQDHIDNENSREAKKEAHMIIAKFEEEI